jgi:hypothetical protein
MQTQQDDVAHQAIVADGRISDFSLDQQFTTDRKDRRYHGTLLPQSRTLSYDF